jgi:hypothetical protein
MLLRDGLQLRARHYSLLTQKIKTIDMTSEGSRLLGDGWWYRIVGQSRSGTVGIDTPSRPGYSPQALPAAHHCQTRSVLQPADFGGAARHVSFHGGLNLLFLVTVLAEKIKLKWRWKMISL